MKITDNDLDLIDDEELKKLPNENKTETEKNSVLNKIPRRIWLKKRQYEKAPAFLCKRNREEIDPQDNPGKII